MSIIPKRLCVLLFAVALSWPSGLFASESASKKWMPFAQLEYWMADDAYEKNEQDFNDAMAFGSALSGSSDISEGMGIRLGAFWPTKTEGFDIGASLGYIKGPEGKFNIRFPFTGISPQEINDEYDTTFIRVLFEARKCIDISTNMGINLRGGIGLAMGDINDSYSISYFPGLKRTTEFSDSWTGASFELAPSFVIKGSSLNFEIGVAYAVFPKLKETEDLYEFTWNPFGLWVGMQF